MSKYLIFAHGDLPNGGMGDLYDISNEYCEAEDLATTSIELIEGPNRYAYVWSIERNDVVFNIALRERPNPTITTSVGFTDIDDDWVDGEDDWEDWDEDGE